MRDHVMTQSIDATLFARDGGEVRISIFVMAAFMPIVGAYVTIADLCPLEAVVEKMLGAGSS